MSNLDEHLFEPTRDRNKMVMLDGSGAPSDTELASAYQRSAQIIIDQEARYANIDLLFFPVALLLRHSLELKLKATIRRCWRVNSEPSSYDWPLHELDDLAQRLDLERGRMEVELLQESTRKVIAILDGIDPKGDRFRYSESWCEDAATFEFDDAKYFDIHAFYNKVQEAMWDIEYTWELIDQIEESYGG